MRDEKWDGWKMTTGVMLTSLRRLLEGRRIHEEAAL